MALDAWTQMMTNTTALWNGQLGTAVAEVNREWLDFINRRLTQDVALMQSLSACKSPDEVWRAYADFWQVAAKDYQEEFAELAKLGNAALEAGAGELSEAAAVKFPEASSEPRAA